MPQVLLGGGVVAYLLVIGYAFGHAERRPEGAVEFFATVEDVAETRLKGMQRSG